MAHLWTDLIVYLRLCWNGIAVDALLLGITALGLLLMFPLDERQRQAQTPAEARKAETPKRELTRTP